MAAGKKYYLRFTVQESKPDDRQHSSFVTAVAIYDNPAKSASDPAIRRKRLALDEISDAKLRDFFERAKEYEALLYDSSFGLQREGNGTYSDAEVSSGTKLQAEFAARKRRRMLDAARALVDKLGTASDWKGQKKMLPSQETRRNRMTRRPRGVLTNLPWVRLSQHSTARLKWLQSY